MKSLINDNWEFTLEGAQTKNVNLPHDWAMELPFREYMTQAGAQGFRYRFSKGTYKKTVNIDTVDKCKTYLLHFDGVFENSTVFVNGIYAGGKKYGYSPFDVDITKYICSGENTVVVEVDNTQHPVDRWYCGCGIYRNVYLIERPVEYIDRNSVIITKSNDVLDIVTGTDKPVCAELDIDGVKYSETGCGKISFKLADYRRWSADSPVLYTLTLTLCENGFSEEFKIGLRDIEISSKGLFVNGKAEKLKGVCVHQDAAMFGIAVPPEIWRDRLHELKKIGCNAIRPSHHIFTPEFMDLCDELGFYVYDECFDKWISGSYGRMYETEWKTDMTAMIERDRNRPSVIIWGMGNEVEFQGQEDMLKRLQNHCELARSLDPTRPVCYAMNPHFKRRQKVNVRDIEDIQVFVDEIDEYEIYKPEDKIEIIRKIADIVDIIGCNYQENWYDLLHESMPDKPILGTETHQFKTDIYEQLNAFPDENPWVFVQDRDFVLGGMIWTGIDYFGESTIWPSKGFSGAMFYMDMLPRAGAYIMKSFWSDEPFVKFFVMDYSLRDEGVKENWDIPRYASHWHFPQVYRTLLPIMITSNCDEVELKLNGKVMMRKSPSDFLNRTVTGYIMYEKGEVEVNGYIDGKLVATDRVVTPDCAVALDFGAETENVPAGEYKIFTVKAVDRNGNHVFRESANVLFRAEGAIEVYGVASGDIMSFEPYRHNMIHMYHGTASVAIKSNGGRGKLYAFADGMCAGELIIC